MCNIWSKINQSINICTFFSLFFFFTKYKPADAGYKSKYELIRTTSAIYSIFHLAEPEKRRALLVPIEICS